MGGNPVSGREVGYAYFLTLGRTGCRRGELAALRWDTCYFDRIEDGKPAPRAWLERTYSPHAAYPKRGPNKGKKLPGDIQLKTYNPHEVDLGLDVVEALKGLRQERREQALARGLPPSVYVFTTTRCARILSDSAVADDVFRRGMAALELTHKRHTTHDLRDTFATTNLIADPGSLYWVSWMLGHRDPTTTLRRYARWTKEMSGGARFAQAFDKVRPLEVKR